MNVIFNILTDFLSWSRDTGDETNKQKKCITIILASNLLPSTQFAAVD